MPKNTEIQTHLVGVPSAVEIARSNMATQREISMIEKILKVRQTLQIFRGIVFKKLPSARDFSSLTNLIRMIE